MVGRYEVRQFTHLYTHTVTHICYFKDTALWCAALLKEHNKPLKIKVWDTENNCEVKEEYEPYNHYKGRVKKKNKKALRRYEKSHPQKAQNIDGKIGINWFTSTYDANDHRWIL